MINPTSGSMFPGVYSLSCVSQTVQPRIYEVAPRDGLQAEKAFISTEDKVAFIRGIMQAGLRDIEITSFVPKKWIPQFVDSSEVVEECIHLNETEFDNSVTFSAFVPNIRGLETAVSLGITKVGFVQSATESFSQKNLNCSVEDNAEMIRQLSMVCSDSSINSRCYISMAFGDPWEGTVPSERVLKLAINAFTHGADQVVLSDTIGVATPGQIKHVLSRFNEEGIDLDRVALHLHDTYGQSIANVLMALTMGISEFDSSAGGLGKCPYAKGATGNVATEQLMWLLNGLGYELGADTAGIAQTVAKLQENYPQLQLCGTSRALAASVLS